MCGLRCCQQHGAAVLQLLLGMQERGGRQRQRVQGLQVHCGAGCAAAEAGVGCESAGLLVVCRSLAAAAEAELRRSELPSCACCTCCCR